MSARGGGKIQGLFALVVTVAIGMVAYRLIPVYGQGIEFKNAMINQAKMAAVTRKAPDVIQDELFAKAKEIDIPMKRDQIQVQQMQTGVRITARFSIPVDLWVYQTEISFDYAADTASAY
jgi:hypothetical protein